MNNTDSLSMVTLAQENLFAHVAFVQQRLPGMLSLDLAGEGLVQLVDSGLASDTFNKVLWNCDRRLCTVAVNQKAARACLQAAAAYIAASGRDFSLWVRPDIGPDLGPDIGPGLEPDLGPVLGAGLGPDSGAGLMERASGAAAGCAVGLTLQEKESAMFLPLQQLQSQPGEASTACAGLRLVQADTPERIAAFASVLAAHWSPPEEAVLAFYRAATPLLLQEQAPMRLFVGFAGDEPLACGELFLSHGGQVAGLHCICTREAFRRKGLGMAMSAALLRAGLAAGAGLAVLLASAEGDPVYRRLGFAPCGIFHELAFTEEIVHP